MTFIASPDDTAAPVGVMGDPDTGALEAFAACDVCEHPIAEHDSISLRYCEATMSNALRRRCICSTSGT